MDDPGSILHDLPALAILPPKPRKLVVDSFVPASFPFGSVILREGDEADALYVIASGRARAVSLQGELSRNPGGELTVVAPCAGAVVRLPVKESGAVVQEGEVLYEVACAGGALQAELAVPPGGVSRLKPGQEVKLLYDAFPYQRYGVRFGTVRWTSPAGMSVEGTSAFRALVDLTDTAIRVDGQPRPLLAGMGGRADVVVGRRTLIGYALEPLRQLKESLVGAPVKQ